MKLQQLRAFVEVVRRDLSVGEAAKALFTSQPGLSHHIRTLENELKSEIFVRRGKRIVALTKTGRDVLAISQRILSEAENLKRIVGDSQDEAEGDLIVAATHTQARYTLPAVVRTFIATHPKVRLSIKPCSPMEAADLVRRGEANLCISTEVVGIVEELVMIPGEAWDRCVITPPKHPLLRVRRLDLESIQKYPLITYDFAFQKHSKIRAAFEARGLSPSIVLTSADTGIIKTYVSAGLGVGIIASIAYHRAQDTNLRKLDASHLFESSMTAIGLHRNSYVPRYMYDFIQLVFPRVNRNLVKQLVHGSS
jgi:LysR family transcriptional regulator, cys regulon transcriptional activator